MSKQQVRLVEVNQDQAGRRLDNYLAALLKPAPKSFIYRIIRRGEVRVNGGRSRPDRKLEAGDMVRVPPVHIEASGPRPLSEATLALVREAVIYEDAALLIINKPAGMAVHAGTGLQFGVVDVVRHLRPEVPGIELVHRLDRDTSGCLVLAKDYPSLRDLQAQLRSPASHKTYVAVLDGALPEPVVEVDLCLQTTRHGGEKRTEVAADGKTAHTRFTSVETFADACLVEAEITTGRTHQIRVHAAALGHPVIGDKKYAPADLNTRHRNRGCKRMFLHARSIRLRSPAGGERRAVTAPLPRELQRYIETLRQP
ncbi:MAG: RluA family pseudouridine synthase [Gammaproteobacteria bacterium]|jgi:23S rRNA pseudouridine955/2504/2580 synthase